VPSPLDRFLTAIGYPEKASEGATSFPLLVDDGEVLVSAEGVRLVLSRVLSREPEDFPRLASFVPGRMLREEAVLAADPGADGAAFLWRELPADASAGAMQLAFEAFCDSCDWWLERVDEFSAPQPEIPPLTIRP
jgi:hypothetical protein